jgi:8-oxo-dGTP pyrophosphatase MutT (NUDIX family)
MTTLKIDSIIARLEQHSPVACAITETTRQAAVAAIIRPGEHTEVLFILRASKEGDPWSGQMAFPGGHREPSDRDIRHTAERETWEEIGLDLGQHGRYLGQLEQVRVNPRGRNIDMVVTPVVYVLESPDAVMTPNYEVADILWGSLDDMHAGRSLTEQEFMFDNQAQAYTGYSVGGEVVWGLTLRMLDHLFTLIDPGFKPRGL